MPGRSTSVKAVVEIFDPRKVALRDAGYRNKQKAPSGPKTGLEKVNVAPDRRNEKKRKPELRVQILHKRSSKLLKILTKLSRPSWGRRTIGAPERSSLGPFAEGEERDAGVSNPFRKIFRPRSGGAPDRRSRRGCQAWPYR